MFMAHLKEAVTPEPEGLMNLEIKADCLFLCCAHIVYLVCCKTPE